MVGIHIIKRKGKENDIEITGEGIYKKELYKTKQNKKPFHQYYSNLDKGSYTL